MRRDIAADGASGVTTNVPPSMDSCTAISPLTSFTPTPGNTVPIILVVLLTIMDK